MRVADDTERLTERARKRRAQIVEVAREMFLALPYSQVSVEAIAAMVGISKVTVYSYFDSKLDIYCAILAADAQSLFEAFDSAADPARGLASNLTRLSSAYSGFLRKHPEYFQRFSWYFLPGREQRLPAKIGGVIGEKFAAAQAVIERCLTAAAERGEIPWRDFKLSAQAIYAQWLGLAYLHMLSNDESGRAKRDHQRIRSESDALLMRGLG